MNISKEIKLILNPEKKENKVLKALGLLGSVEKKNKGVVIDITISRSKPKRKVRVFSNFVKVGWDQYSIKRDFFTGYEYVIIKGSRYEVVRDLFGQGYLVEL